MSDIWFWAVDYLLTILGLAMMAVIYRRQEAQERRIERLLEKEDAELEELTRIRG